MNVRRDEVAAGVEAIGPDYTRRVPPLFRTNRRLHFSDTDAARVVWFGNFAAFFEAAEDELYRALGAPRIAFMEQHRFVMPRIEFTCRYRSPGRADEILQMRIGMQDLSARRLTYVFEGWEPEAQRLLVEGTCRVASIAHDRFEPCDFPAAVGELLAGIPALVERQARGEVGIPWT